MSSKDTKNPVTYQEDRARRCKVCRYIVRVGMAKTCTAHKGQKVADYLGCAKFKREKKQA
jgi:hypothetical protein